MDACWIPPCNWKNPLTTQASTFLVSFFLVDTINIYIYTWYYKHIYICIIYKYTFGPTTLPIYIYKPPVQVSMPTFERWHPPVGLLDMTKPFRMMLPPRSLTASLPLKSYQNPIGKACLPTTMAFRGELLVLGRVTPQFCDRPKGNTILNNRMSSTYQTYHSNVFTSSYFSIYFVKKPLIELG